ncbi:hypothetical protein LAZ40_09515 [Cereibacter sphaeroides]|uniref:hypothetical protein n=1 Tax=Cereibacter sphaeroides TaxID=1063 RepID=UPI001F3A0CC6|nr:hypothetical protein [Cereibacter sphaeroides]MCE6959290.1 hypothetical protein [Cereibacter sphaeroides]MCE6972882.1 hypothetical protein [Cereibacter sphaeroides]
MMIEHPFFRELRAELAARREAAPLRLLSDAELRATRDPALADALEAWCAEPTTVGLREVLRPLGDYWTNLPFANTVDAIDAAMLAVRSPMPEEELAP